MSASVIAQNDKLLLLQEVATQPGKADICSKSMTRTRTAPITTPDHTQRARSPKRCETRKVEQPTVTMSKHDLQLQERLREEIAVRKLQNAALEVP